MIAYLFMDCEMGGRELKYSLLTAYFLATDSKFRKIGDLYLEVKPDDGCYIVSGQGMTVNRINLQEHDRQAVPYKDAKGTFFAFLSAAYKKLGRLTPVGHGVKGDIEHCIGRLCSQGSWEQFCTYHYIDTSVVLQYLRAIGKMPEDCDGSVGALGRYFGIINETHPNMFSAPNAIAESELHNAKIDAEITMGVFKEFVRLGRMTNDDGPASHEVSG